jgi:alkylated DNA repair dioxygenase AlkB
MKNILPQEGEVYLIENFLSQQEADHYLSKFRENLEWHQDDIKLFGKTHLAPRLTAWYGEEGISYSYSGVKLKAKAWTPDLLEIKEKLKSYCETEFNSVLLNYYRSGQDSMGWHSDDEKELGVNPVIASVSLGQERVFHFRHKKEKNLKVKIALKSGSLLLMKGETQHFWQHQIPKSKKPMQSRINLTFRDIRF